MCFFYINISKNTIDTTMKVLRGITLLYAQNYPTGWGISRKCTSAEKKYIFLNYLNKMESSIAKFWTTL